MSARVFAGVLGWVLAGLVAAFLAVLLVGAAACRRRTRAADRVARVCAFAARVLPVFCAIVGAALYICVVLWFFGF